MENNGISIGKRMAELADTLRVWQHAYYVDARPLVSDLEYDKAFDELSLLERQNPSLADPASPTLRVGSDLSSDFPEFTHTIPVLSLDKAYSSEAILSWIGKAQLKARSRLSFVVEEKIDGLSMVLYYEKGILIRAVTRGNGTTGNDVTANLKTVRSVPLKLTEPVDIVVRGEVYLPKADFMKINATLEEPYANPRNLAAGSIRRQKSSETASVPLAMFCYEGFDTGIPFSDHIEILSYLKKLGFRIDSHLGFFAPSKEEARKKLSEAGLEGTSGSFDDIPDYIAKVTAGRKALEYEIDGLVCKVNELDVREEFGYTGHHPRWAIAYKFEAPQAETKVLSVDIQIGRTGRVTPVARLVPVTLSGSTIANITLHNCDYIDQLELAVGDTVSISKRGDVIPAVEAVTEKNDDGNRTWVMPDKCPECGSSLVKNGAHHFCPNRGCPAQAKGRISFFAAKGQMDIEGLGPETVAVLYDNGFITEIEDLFTFDFNRLTGLRGFGDKKVTALKNAVADTRKADFRQVFTSLGIPECSRKAIELLCDAGIDSMDKLLSIADRHDIAALTAVSQIGERTAEILIDSLNSEFMRNLIAKLAEAGLCMEDKKVESSVSRIFEGQSWCVTGSFENFSSRDLIHALIKERGGNPVTSVSAKTTVLLVGSAAGSKLEKARKLGVRTMDEREFTALIGDAGRQDGEPEKKTEEQPDLF